MTQQIHSNYKEYIISTDKWLMHPEMIHDWLSKNAYWCKGIPFEIVNAAFQNSFCIAAFYGNDQVAYGRLITDYCTFAYLADVFVLEEHRGKGLGKKMMQLLFDLDWVKSLRRIMLATRDAHELYKQVGFTELKNPDRIMEIVRPDIYQKELSGS